MILAERGAPTGDYELLAVRASERSAACCAMRRYRLLRRARRRWQSVADQYAIGFPGQSNNANGGVAVGYSYDANGNIDPASCGGFVWSTGEQLRNAADQTLAAALAANGSLYVNGLQGNGIGILEPANVPPLLSYFVDYNALPDDPAARGHMGDIAIPANCAPLPRQGQLLAPGVPLPAPVLPPVVYVPRCPFGELQTVNGRCHGYGGCPPGEIWDPRGRSCHPLPSCTNGMTRNANGTCVCPAGRKHQRRHHQMCVRLSAGPDAQSDDRPMRSVVPGRSNHRRRHHQMCDHLSAGPGRQSYDRQLWSDRLPPRLRAGP